MIFGLSDDSLASGSRVPVTEVVCQRSHNRVTLRDVAE